MRSLLRILIIFLVIPCLFLAGCRKPARENDSKAGGIILGFSQIGAESAWRNCNTRSVQDAASAAGIQLLYFNAEQKQENQIKAIRSFIAYQVDVIAFVPIVSSGWENVLGEARDAGIPVLVCDREINIQDESQYSGFIGTNSLQEGRSAAEYLIKKYSPQAAADKTAAGTASSAAHAASEKHPAGKRPVRIIELVGTEGSSVAIKRAKGFRDVLAEYGAKNGEADFQIIYSVSGDFLRSKGYELMCSILDTYKDIDVLYSHNDAMTLGALDAIKERGIKPGTDIVIVTIDAEQAAIDALKRGEVNCVVECNPKQGPDIIRLATLLAKGKTIPRTAYMKEEVFTEWDDLSKLPPRGY